MKDQISATGLLDTLSRQTDGAEVFELRSTALPVSFRAGELESVKAVNAAGRAVRVIKEGKQGFSTTTDMADDTVVVQSALASAQFGDPAPFSFPSDRPRQTVLCLDDDLERLDEIELVQMGEQVVDRISSAYPDLQVDVFIDKEIQNVCLVNTDDLKLDERRTSLALGIEVTRAVEGDILTVSDQASSRSRAGVDGMALADGIVERVRLSEGTASVESKAMPVVFSPRGAPVLLLPLMLGLNGRNVYLGSSPLGDKLGQQVLDSRITLVDDGRIDFAARSSSFDDEGVPTSTKELVAAGVVRQFLYDLRTAAQAGSHPTGNGFKAGLFGGGGFRNPPGVAPTTWRVAPGERNLQQILENLEEALLVEQVIGLGQGNVIAGEFSNNVSVGYLVRRGEIVGRVKNTMIAGNVYDVLRNRLIALSNQPEWVYGLLYVPAIAVDGISVASQG